MAVLYQFLESFTGYDTTNGASLANVCRRWSGNATPITSSGILTTAGPFSGAMGIELKQTAGMLGIAFPSSGSWCKVGFWMLRVESNSNDIFPVLLREGTTSHVTMRVSQSGAISLLRGGTAGTVIATSAGTPLQAVGQWYWVEARIRIADSISAGDAVVYVNGVEALSLSAGADTRNGLTGVVNRMDLFSGATSVNASWLRFGGLYFELIEGQSDPLYGPCRVDTVYPTSDGHHQDGTPSTGADRWATVDEDALDVNDYNDLADVGDRDSFGVGTLPALVDPAVFGVSVHVMARASDAGSRSAAPMLRVGSADYDGTASALGADTVGYHASWPTNPAGGAWTQSAAQSAQPGAVVTA
jgi:hypothetical protein